MERILLFLATHWDELGHGISRVANGGMVTLAPPRGVLNTFVQESR